MPGSSGAAGHSARGSKAVPILCPAPIERMLVEHRRNCFRWNVDNALERFQGKLRGGDEVVRLDEIATRWDSLESRLGGMRGPWAWWLHQWESPSVLGVRGSRSPARDRGADRLQAQVPA